MKRHPQVILFALSFLVFLAPVGALAQTNCATAPSGLVAWWPGDGFALDLVGTKNGSLQGGTAYTSGEAGQSFLLDGVTGYVLVPDSVGLSPHLGTNGELSVEAWVYMPRLPQFDSATGQNRRAVVAKGSPNQWEYALNIYTSGAPEFSVWNANGSGYGNVIGSAVTLTNWHHILGALKKGLYAQLYVDGQLVNQSTNFTGATSDGTSPLFIGRRGDGQFFEGRVDEVSIYNRALASNEVAALYAAGSAGKCYTNDPVPVFVVQPASQTGYVFNDATF